MQVARASAWERAAGKGSASEKVDEMVLPVLPVVEE
jgi:hypothetical protein